jgi:prolyl oligopeptidase
MQDMKAEMDPYLWLEEIDGEEALDWVKAQNKVTLDKYETTELFSEIEKASLEILDSKEKLAYPQFVGEFVYNFWRDEIHVRGLLRRMSVDAYLANEKIWESVLDIDKLGEDEDENWVYKGQQILAPENQRTLIWLSRGGSDACVVREFDLTEKAFVEDGFLLPEAKSDLAWKDRDTLYVGTKFDDQALTDSGYPRVIKTWHRGTPLEDATFLFEVQASDLAAHAWVVRRTDERHEFLCRTIDFWNEETLYLVGDQQTLLPLPSDAPLRGLFKGHLLVTPRSEFTCASGTFASGTLLAVKLEGLLNGHIEASLLYDPKDGGTIESVSCLKKSLIVTITENVQTTLHRFCLEDGAWTRTPIEVRSGGAASLIATSAWRDDFFLTHESFLTPTTLFYHTAEGELTELQSLPQRFSAEGIVTEQLWAESTDGTKVPYYIMRHESANEIAVCAPAILYGYGGFEVSLLPRYLSLVGMNWLERGGIYISANIRGGGEFGPSWHQAALREKRHRAFEDFEAIARDVVGRGFTTPKNLAVHGGSNGGLLTGAMLTRSPELFGAVLVGVPLLDMKRYHKLLAGASWMAEYGDPDNPKDWEYLQTFSPYHRLEKERSYPPVLLYTSTKDDRVHPGHARKMVAKLKEYGHTVDYYENLEGGHAGVSNNKQQAFLTALIYSYLWDKLA